MVILTEVVDTLSVYFLHFLLIAALAYYRDSVFQALSPICHKVYSLVRNYPIFLDYASYCFTLVSTLLFNFARSVAKFFFRKK